MRLLPVLLCLPALLLVSACHDSSVTRTDTIAITGVADAQAIPDQFVIHAAAVTQAGEVATASQQVNASIDKVLALTDRLGIDRKQVESLSLQITPQWDWNQGNRSFRGYEARRSLAITLNDLTHYSELLQGLVDSGVTDIGNTDAQIANSGELQMQLMVDAIKDAHSKAERLAAAAGRQVQQAITIQPIGTAAPAMARKMLMAAPAADATTYEPGQTRLHQEVNVTFSLQ